MKKIIILLALLLNLVPYYDLQTRSFKIPGEIWAQKGGITCKLAESGTGCACSNCRLCHKVHSIPCSSCPCCALPNQSSTGYCQENQINRSHCGGTVIYDEDMICPCCDDETGRCTNGFCMKSGLSWTECKMDKPCECCGGISCYEGYCVTRGMTLEQCANEECPCCHSFGCKYGYCSTAGTSQDDCPEYCNCCDSYSCDNPNNCDNCPTCEERCDDVKCGICSRPTSWVTGCYCGDLLCQGHTPATCCCGDPNCPGKPCVTCLCGNDHCTTPNTAQCECCPVPDPHCTGCCIPCPAAVQSPNSGLNNSPQVFDPKKKQTCECANGKVADGNGGCKCPSDKVDDGNGGCKCPDGKVDNGKGGCMDSACVTKCTAAAHCPKPDCKLILKAISGCECGEVCPRHPCPTTIEDIKKVFPVPPGDSALIRKFTNLLNTYGKDWGIDNKEKLQYFLGQICKETGGLQKNGKVEGMNYTTEKRLLAKFDKKFSNTDTITKRKPSGYLNDEKKLANYVYCCGAGDLGNGDEESGDGYRFRGRGMIQMTGRWNFNEFQKAYNKKYPDKKIDVISSDEKAELITTNDTLAVISALWFYKTKVLNSKLKIDANTDVNKITKIVNPGEDDQGKADRKTYTETAKTNIDCNW